MLQRLAAVLHYTGLREQYPVDLRDSYATPAHVAWLVRPPFMFSPSVLVLEFRPCTHSSLHHAGEACKQLQNSSIVQRQQAWC